MLGRLAFATTLLFFLLLPAQAAGASSFGDVEAAVVHVASGSIAGPVVGAAWLPYFEATEIQVPGFSIVARHAQVTIEHSDRLVNANGVVPYSERGATTTWRLDNVTASGGRGDGDDLRLLALPNAGQTFLAVQAPGVTVHCAQGTDRSFDSRTGGQTFAFPVSTALQVALPAGQLVRLEGSFRLVVAGMDATLVADQGRHDLHTREDSTDYAALPDPLSVRHTVVHEAVLDLEDAVVVLPVGEAYVSDAVLESQGVWTLKGANGLLQLAGDDQELHGDVALDGDLHADLARAGDAVTASLSGSLDGLRVDGEGLDVGATTSRTAHPGLSLALGSALAVLLLAAVHVAVGRSRFERMDTAMDRRDYAKALALARRFALHPRLVQDAALAQAICLLALGKPAAALQGIDTRHRWAQHRRAMRDFLAARAEAALGHAEAAVHRLAASLAANPALLPEAQLDPVLAPLLRAVRPGPPEAYA